MLTFRENRLWGPAYILIDAGHDLEFGIVVAVPNYTTYAITFNSFEGKLISRRIYV